jgi:thiamine-phosphate pyrophosphorylase
MRHLKLGKLYPITASNNLNGLDHAQLVEQYLKGGSRFIQVREPALHDSLLYPQLLKIQSLCEPLGARFLINNRVDLALAVGAHGVHLGQDDLPVRVARDLLGEEAVIGLSTHNRQQFLDAQSQDVNYIAMGPVFSTSTKETENVPLGVEALGELIADSRYPVVAIGGISLEKAPQVWTAGADSVAVISDIANAEDPARQVSRYLSLAKESQPS